MRVRLALTDATRTGAIALALALPILGVVLEGSFLVFRLERALVAAGVVFLGRLLLNLAPHWAVVQTAKTTLSGLWAPWGAHSQRMGQALWRRQRTSLLLLALAVLTFPFLPISSNYLLQIAALAMVYVLLATGLNIVVGLAGLLDLGYVAFFAVGAYSYALLAAHFGISFWLALPLGAALAATAGAVLAFPVLRMHGDYLAIVTLGFGEIIRLLLTNLTSITGGPNGISAPRPTLFGLAFSPTSSPDHPAFHEALGLTFDPGQRYVFIYLCLAVFTALALWVFYRLREMPMGRAWEALREDEIACKALGINPVTTKLSAFALGASFGGLAGVIFAAMEGFINPTSFSFMESAMVLAMVVLGGMGSMVGVAGAAVVITLLPEAFRELEDYRMLMFGLAMVGVMVWRPGGLLRLRRKQFPAVIRPEAP